MTVAALQRACDADRVDVPDRPDADDAWKERDDRPTFDDKWTAPPTGAEIVPFVAKPRNRTLFEISEDFQAIDDLLMESQGEVTAEASAIVDAWFAECDSNRDSKIDGYAAFITEVDHRAEARKAEADRMARRARIDENTRDYLKSRLKDFFIQRGLKKLETNRFRVSVVGNGGALPLLIDPHVEANAATKLPEKYRRTVTTVVVNKDAIRADLIAGVEIDGCSLGKRGNRLAIA